MLADESRAASQVSTRDRGTESLKWSVAMMERMVSLWAAWFCAGVEDLEIGSGTLA